MSDEKYSGRTRMTTVKLPNGDTLGFLPCEPMENVYPTAFMTPEEIEQGRQRHREFARYLDTFR